MTYALIQNSAGTWVTPSDDAFKSAAAGADWKKTYYQVLTNQAGKESWPISGATYILVHSKDFNTPEIKATLKFFDWAYTTGDASADDLDYVALPETVKNQIRADWKRLGN